MTLHGRVENGVIVLTDGAPLADGTLVNIMPFEERAGPSVAAPGQQPPYPVSQEQQEALLGLIGMWNVENPPDDQEVERLIDEYRMKKHG